MRFVTTDQAAVAVMLSPGSAAQKQAELDTLLTQSAVAHGLQCEECESRLVEDNGARGVDLTFRCTACGHQWSPNV